ncbi:hydrogenase maturation protease [Candidatus Latescibacterota bacterium]
MTKAPHEKILLIGYGNPAREDDGLGPSVADEIEKLAIDGITVDADYQLTVEYAAAVAEYDTVIFVDASVSGREPFSLNRLTPERQESFSSHSITPEAVLGLAQELFSAGTSAYILGIRGYSFSMFTETMTEKAQVNREKALKFLVPMLRSKSFQLTA